MKRRLFTTVTTFFMLAGLALLPGCDKQGAKQEAAASATAAVTSDTAAPKTAEAKKIIIGVDDGLAPITFRDANGALVGYDVDLARETFRRLGMDSEFKTMAWAKKDDEMKSKRIDVIWSGMTITDERKKIYNFSTPYLVNRQAITVSLNSPIKSKADLGGKVVGIQTGSFVTPALEKYSGPNGAIRKIENYPEVAVAMAALLEGKADAVVLDEVSVRYYASRTPGKFYILDDNFGVDNVGVGFRKEDTALLEKVNTALAAMNADGTIQRIYAKWFEEKKQ